MLASGLCRTSPKQVLEALDMKKVFFIGPDTEKPRKAPKRAVALGLENLKKAGPAGKVLVFDAKFTLAAAKIPVIDENEPLPAGDVALKFMKNRLDAGEIDWGILQGKSWMRLSMGRISETPASLMLDISLKAGASERNKNSAKKAAADWFAKPGSEIEELSDALSPWIKDIDSLKIMGFSEKPEFAEAKRAAENFMASMEPGQSPEEVDANARKSGLDPFDGRYLYTVSFGSFASHSQGRTENIQQPVRLPSREEMLRIKARLDKGEDYKTVASARGADIELVRLLMYRTEKQILRSGAGGGYDAKALKNAKEEKKKMRKGRKNRKPVEVAEEPSRKNLEHSTAEMHEMVQNGRTITDIAEEVGLTKGAVSRRLKRWREKKGIEKSVRNRKIQKPKEIAVGSGQKEKELKFSNAEMHEMRMKGRTMENLAEEVGMSVPGLSNRLRRWREREGVESVPMERRLKFSNAEMHAMRQKGWTIKDLAEEVGLSTGAMSLRLRNWRRKEGIEDPWFGNTEKELKFSNAEMDEMVRDGRMIKDIAEEVGLTKGAVSMRLRKYRKREGIEERPKIVPTQRKKTLKYSMKKIDRMHRKGRKMEDIAREAGISTSRLYVLLKNHRERKDK